MSISLLDKLGTKWRGFRYNFQWPDYDWLLDGWLSRLAYGVPLVGYLVLFNDTISANLQFESLAGQIYSPLDLSSGARLKFIYLGLVFLGLGNVLYRLLRPYVMKFGVGEFNYVETALKHFTFSAYNELHHRIRRSEFDPMTVHGKYYDSEWEGFRIAAIGPVAKTLREGEENQKQADWTAAKNKYESLLRSILIETHFCEVTKKRGQLAICLGIALLGYMLLLIPSADLFISVMSKIALSGINS